MSIGSFQHLPGAHEMGGGNAFPNEPWLLPISDRAPEAVSSTTDALQQAVRLASRKLWLIANALGAALALLLTAQIATDWRSPVGHPATSQLADASPPTLAAEKAALSVDH